MGAYKYSDVINMLLKELSVDWQLPSLQLSDDNECYLQYKDDFQIGIKVNDIAQTLTLHAYIFDLKEFQSENFYKQLMKWNYEGFERSGVYLGYCERNHSLATIFVYSDASPVKNNISDLLDNFIELNLKIKDKMVKEFSQKQPQDNSKDKAGASDHVLWC